MMAVLAALRRLFFGMGGRQNDPERYFGIWLAKIEKP